MILRYNIKLMFVFLICVDTYAVLNEEKIEEVEEIICSICRDSINSELIENLIRNTLNGAASIQLPCKDVFHQQCLLNWQKQAKSYKCRNCEANIPASIYSDIYSRIRNRINSLKDRVILTPMVTAAIAICIFWGYLRQKNGHISNDEIAEFLGLRVPIAHLGLYFLLARDPQLRTALIRFFWGLSFCYVLGVLGTRWLDL